MTGFVLGVRLGERADGSELSPECMERRERAVAEDHRHSGDRISRKRDPQRRASISLLCIRTNLGTPLACSLVEDEPDFLRVP